MINQSDKHILRELARRVAEIAAEPVQEERRQLWKKINSLEPCRIPFVLSLGGTPIKYEYVPESELKTTDPVAKSYEHELRMKIWRWENIDDDYVTEPVIHYDIEVRLPGLIAPRKNHPYGDELHAYHVEPVIEKESDIDKIVEESGGQVDWDATARNREWVEEVFDNLLNPMPKAPSPWIAPFDYVCEIRGMENVFFDMIERPEWLEEVMRRVYRAWIDFAKNMESNDALKLNNNRYVYNGGLGYTDELPAEGSDPSHVRLKDIWGFSTAQASVSISPDKFDRFVGQFDREYHGLFGLTGVACCEPVDRKMPVYKTFPNLRRISISVWNDFAMAAEAIGTDYIYSIKPFALPMSQPVWNVEEDLAHLENILEQSKGCHVEIIQRELLTCAGHPERLTEWFRRARGLAERFN